MRITSENPLTSAIAAALTYARMGRRLRHMHENLRSVRHVRINRHVYKQRRHRHSFEESQDGASDCHLSRRTSTLSPTWLMRFPQLGGRPFYESAPMHLRTGSIAETLGVTQTGVNDC
jgi:hypothetical protein